MNDKTQDQLKREAVQAEREKINVEMNKAAEEAKKADEPKEELAKADKEPEEAEAEDEAEDEASEEGEKITEPEKSEEVKKLEEKLEKERQKFEKRINKKTAEAKELAAKIAEIEKQLAAKNNDDEPKLTEADVEARAKHKAEQEINNRQFTDACNRLADAAKKADKEFDKKIQDLSTEVAPLPGYMIGILDDLENGGEVLAHLASNLDEYEDVHTLPPVKMAVSLSKISGKLIEAKKPVAKKVSKVPEPLDKVKGNPKVQETLSDNDPMEDWIAKRNRQVAERQAAKRAGMR